MGKKDAAKMENMRVKFLEGAEQKKIERKTAQDIFDLMAKFAEYGFNKAHATVYAHVAYQSAYLKAHYPIEFMTANLSSVLDNQDDLLIIKNEAERMGIRILPPDVNYSENECCIDNNAIRLGLGTIKNVGKAALSILEERSKKKSFKSLFDLCATVDLRLVNKKCLESLACAGALDSLHGTRAQLFASIDKGIDYGNSFQKDRLSGQTSLFDLGTSDSAAASEPLPEPPLMDVVAWPYSELLAKEKDVLNFYVSGHPLKPYEDEIRGFADTTLRSDALELLKDNASITIGGQITTIKTHIQRDGKPMAFLMVEDFDGSIELLVFGEAYEKFKEFLTPDSMVLIRGQVSMREGDKKPKLRAENIMSLPDTREKLTKSIHVRLKTNGLEESFVNELHAACTKVPGSCSLILHVMTTEDNEYKIKAKNITTSPAKELLEGIRNKLGKENVWLSKFVA